MNDLFQRASNGIVPHRPHIRFTPASLQVNLYSRTYCMELEKLTNQINNIQFYIDNFQVTVAIGHSKNFYTALLTGAAGVTLLHAARYYR